MEQQYVSDPNTSLGDCVGKRIPHGPEFDDLWGEIFNAEKVFHCDACNCVRSVAEGRSFGFDYSDNNEYCFCSQCEDPKFGESLSEEDLKIYGLPGAVMFSIDDIEEVIEEDGEADLFSDVSLDVDEPSIILDDLE